MFVFNSFLNLMILMLLLMKLLMAFNVGERNKKWKQNCVCWIFHLCLFGVTLVSNR